MVMRICFLFKFHRSGKYVVVCVYALFSFQFLILVVVVSI